MKRLRLTLALVAGGVLLAVQPALAQQFPSKNVTIVVPVAPGGPLDILARSVQPRLQALLGQPVIIDNRVGAGTYIGTEYVAKAPPDGYVLLCQASSGVHSHLFVKEHSVMSRELTPVAQLSDAPYAILTSALVPAKNLKEFFDYVKASPKKYNVATFPNTTNYLEAITFLRANGADMVEVPYNSGAAIYAAMVRNDVQFYVSGIGGARPFLEAGTLRALAVPSAKRVDALPDVATAKEQGYEFESSVLYLLLAPAKTPQATLRLLNEKTNEALSTPEVRERLVKAGFPVATPTQEQLAARLAAEARAMEKAAKDAGITPK
jgi:tripartite-type tricarboxylate transporter receptor subunit TctC